MAIRVGVDGFGRICSNFFRAGKQVGADGVAATTWGRRKTMAHLLRYDSTLAAPLPER